MFFLVRIDTNGIVTTRRLTPKLTHILPANEKVELSYCRMLGKSIWRFPIDRVDWRKMSDNWKNEAWEIIKVIRVLKYYHYLKLFSVILLIL